MLTKFPRQYLNKKSLRQRPTAHLSYDEGLHLIRSFLDFASHHTVEELQAFTSQWVPHPQWVKVKEDTIPDAQLKRAAELLLAQLGEEGLRQVGGRQWWQWRKPNRTLDAEWIEMKSHYNARKVLKEPARRVMMYIHGGAYFFGSVDEHRYQMQRHARKLKARVFAPKYRLAPQFPFPCGLHDCLAAYLHLLTIQDPSTIILAGDSAGGGMAMSLMVILRDQGIPLPAGAILISPWVDLTHSFPSVAGDAPLDYIPQAGFHHKPSRSWPPPNEDDEKMLQEAAAKQREDSRGKHSVRALKEKQQAPVAPKAEDTEAAEKAPTATGGIVTKPEEFLSLAIDGEEIILKEQIQVSLNASLPGSLTNGPDVHHESSPGAPACQYRHAADTGWPSTPTNHGWWRRDPARRTDLSCSQMRQPGEICTSSRDSYGGRSREVEKVQADRRTAPSLGRPLPCSPDSQLYQASEIHVPISSTIRRLGSGTCSAQGD